MRSIAHGCSEANVLVWRKLAANGWALRKNNPAFSTLESSRANRVWCALHLLGGAHRVSMSAAMRVARTSGHTNPASPFEHTCSACFRAAGLRANASCGGDCPLRGTGFGGSRPRFRSTSSAVLYEWPKIGISISRLPRAFGQFSSQTRRCS